jgi:phage shock protein A
MTDVVNAMNDTIESMEYTVAALEAFIRDTLEELIEARQTVADMLAALETALEMLVDSWGEEQITAGDDQVANVLKAAIKAAKGEA